MDALNTLAESNPQVSFALRGVIKSLRNDPPSDGDIIMAVTNVEAYCVIIRTGEPPIIPAAPVMMVPEPFTPVEAAPFIPAETGAELQTN